MKKFLLLFLLATGKLVAMPEPPPKPCLTGLSLSAPFTDFKNQDHAAIIERLRTGKIVTVEWIKGKTDADIVTLEDGTRAIVKHHKSAKQFYKHEIAAYELDRLLDLDVVPPTIFRADGSNTGSYQLWVPDAYRFDLSTQRAHPMIISPDPNLRLLDFLTLQYDRTFLDKNEPSLQILNAENYLQRSDGTHIAIDNSRIFPTFPIKSPAEIRNFLKENFAFYNAGPSVILKLRNATPAILREQFKDLLDKKEMDQLIQQRSIYLSVYDELYGPRN